MDETDGALDDSPGRRGRLHGRLLQVLGAVSTVAAVIALWQFGVFGDAPDREVDVIEGLDSVSIPDGPSASGALASAQPSSAAIESPSESSTVTPSETPSSDAPSSPPLTPLPPGATTPPAAEGGAAACTATLTVDEEWGDSVEVTVSVVNTGGVALSAWEIDLDLRDVEIYNHWSMQELDDGRYGSEDWNGRLDPDEDTQAGFQAETGDRADLPGSVPCTASA